VIFDTFASNSSINRPFTEELSVPALLVHAADDPLAPYDGAVRLAGRLRGARLVTLGRGGHLQLGDARTELRSVVEGF
jgi:pimeloyl-ACP methyl ester carboxylesterase